MSHWKTRSVALSAVAASALTAIAAAPASGATVSGAVVTRDTHRGTVATADAQGRVSTLRVAHANRVRLGTRVRATATQLADGTYRASRVRASGRAAHIRIRATVVRRVGRAYLVSAGASTFSVRMRVTARGRTASGAPTGSGLQPGDVVVVNTTPAGDTLEADQVQQAGQTGMLEVEGIFVDASAGQVRLAVEHQGLVTVAVPDGMTVQASPGDEVQLLVSVGSDGSFTLVAANGDGGHGQSGDGGDGQDQGFAYNVDNGEAEVRGVLSALSADSLTVQAGPGASVTCAVPAGTDLSGFALQDQVKVKCETVSGTLTLHEMESDHAKVEVSSGGDGQGSGDQQGSGGSGDQQGPGGSGDQQGQHGSGDQQGPGGGSGDS